MGCVVVTTGGSVGADLEGTRDRGPEPNLCSYRVFVDAVTPEVEETEEETEESLLQSKFAKGSSIPLYSSSTSASFKASSCLVVLSRLRTRPREVVSWLVRSLVVLSLPPLGPEEVVVVVVGPLLTERLTLTTGRPTRKDATR